MVTENHSLADDLIEGATAIAEFIWGRGAQAKRVYRIVETGRLPVSRIGGRLHARRSVLREWIAGQERRSIADLSRKFPEIPVAGSSDINDA
ncbi:MAG: hypothetical protein AB7F74_23590 [Parvibaculaceae bacterium]